VAVQVGWTSCYKYLGVTLLSGPQFKIDADVIRRKFYASANTVLANFLHKMILSGFTLLKAIVYQF